MYGNLDDFGCTAVDLNSFICKWPFFAKSKFTFAIFSRARVFLSRGRGVIWETQRVGARPCLDNS